MAVQIDEYSCSSLLIQMLFQGRAVSLGTAFSMKSADRSFLITNWHNVTGRNPLTGTHLSPNAIQPDGLRVFFHIKGQLGSWKPQDLDLYDQDGNPLWHEHPRYRSKVDVVALEVAFSADLQDYPINQMRSANDMSIRVGHDVFILGFPFGLSITAAFPVWKRASLATEPDIDIEGLPKFMVDTATRPGMSGSPVIRRPSGQYQTEEGSTIIPAGQVTRFVGIYSGRIGAEDELKAQLALYGNQKS